MKSSDNNSKLSFILITPWFLLVSFATDLNDELIIIVPELIIAALGVIALYLNWMVSDVLIFGAISTPWLDNKFIIPKSCFVIRYL